MFFLVSTHRILVSVCLIFALTACGGGGGGNENTPANTSAGGGTSTSSGGTVGNGNTPPTKNDNAGGSNSGGSNTSGGGNPNPPSGSSEAVSVVANPQSISFRTFRSSTYSAQTQPVAVTFVGDGVLVGFAPGITPPSWLIVNQSTVTAPNGQFTLNVGAQPSTTQLQGTYTSTLRLLTGRVDTGTNTFVDVPISLQILTPPPVYSGSVNFSASTTDTGLPTDQTIALDFGAFTSASFTAVAQDGNSVASSWLTVTPSQSTKTLRVSIHASKLVGSYTANILVTYQANGATGYASIPVQYVVTAGAPQINFSVPAAIYTGVATDIVLRGAGFNLSAVQDVRIGGQSATSFQVINDTQINAHFGSIATTGTQTVEVRMSNSALSSTSAVVVKARPMTAYGSLDLGEPTSVARFDSTTDTILVAGPNTIFRVRLISGNWQVVNQRTISIGNFFLSPDAKQIVYADGADIKTLDAITLQDVATAHLPNMPGLPASAYQYSSIKGILDNGEVLLGLYGGNTGDLYIYQLTNQTLRATHHDIYRTMFIQDHLGMRAFIAANSNEGQDFNGFYVASNASEVSVTLPGGQVYGNRFAFSGSGNRLWLNDNLYDGNYTLLGTLSAPLISNYATELSPDGHKAYFVAAGDGLIRPYNIAAIPYAALSDINFPSYSYYAALPATQVVPDGSMMIFNGGWVNSSTVEPRLTIVPLP